MTSEKSPRSIPSMLRRYGLAFLSVAIALEVSRLLASYKFEGVEFPILLMAVAITVWYVGTGPGILALIMAALAFKYFFAEPRHTLYITAHDIPYYSVFVLFALLIIWFSSLRHRVERELLRSRDELQKDVAIRTRQASLLDLTHDPIFVRDMSGIITYWNRGAQELYGWTPEQAVGRRKHDLLRTIFPKPFEEIQRELLRPAAGKESSRRRRPMERACRWRADGRCSGAKMEVPSRYWRAKTTSPSARSWLRNSAGFWRPLQTQ